MSCAARRGITIHRNTPSVFFPRRHDGRVLAILLLLLLSLLHTVLSQVHVVNRIAPRSSVLQPVSVPTQYYCYYLRILRNTIIPWMIPVHYKFVVLIVRNFLIYLFIFISERLTIRRREDRRVFDDQGFLCHWYSEI